MDSRTNTLGQGCHSTEVQTKTQEASELPSSHGHTKYIATKSNFL